MKRFFLMLCAIPFVLGCAAGLVLRPFLAGFAEGCAAFDAAAKEEMERRRAMDKIPGR
jgi:hypothetical protein